MINHANSDAGLPTCSALTDLPVLQDSADGGTWTTLGATNNSLLFVGPDGLVSGRILAPVYPDVVPQIETLINPLLGL